MGKAPCCSDKSGLKKGPWTPEEDQKLTHYIQQHGHGRWRTLPKNAGLKRCGKSCRLRWTNYLRPDIKRGRFSLEEEETIIQLHSVLGNKWSTIASHLPGRTDNEIKNYWNTHIRKKLLKMGIDPVTHSPRLDLLELSSLLSSALCNASHDLNINLPNLLGLINGPNYNLVDPNLLNNLATTHLFYQQPNKSPNDHFVNSQEVQDYNHLFHHQNQVQNSITFQTFLQNQLQNPISGHVQTSTGQLSQSLYNLLSSCPNSSNNNYLWQNNREASITPNESFVPEQQNYSYKESSQPIINISSSDNQGLVCNGITYNNSNMQNMSYSSVLSSTPNSYSSTPLNSSPKNYVNCSSTTAEDERDSFCNTLMYDIANIPTTLNDVNELL